MIALLSTNFFRIRRDLLNRIVSYLTTCLSLQETGLDPEGAELYEEVHFRDPLCALAVTAGVTAVGLAVFRKKDLK